MHDGVISKMRTSPDGMFAFSAGEDGAVFVYRVHEYDEDGNLIYFQVYRINNLFFFL